MADEKPKEGVKTENNDHINLKVAGQDGSVVQFKIKRHTPLSKLMKAYCERQGLTMRQIRFRFDGQPINETDTPAQRAHYPLNMTTTTTFQGMEPGAKNSSRVLRPPGGASNISFGTDDEKPARKNKMASSGEASGVLCGEPSAPLRRCQPAIVYDNGAPAERPADSVFVQVTSWLFSTHIKQTRCKCGEASGVLCGEPSAPLRRCQPAIVYDNGAPAERPADSVDQNEHEQENNDEAVEQKEEAAQPSAPSPANPSGRRNPPGGKSSLILG
ncbi:Small ubiquitin-related modifier 2 [Anabarilius grahami]|uniref:Small ubiquitin-related modifier 2 n=1 Tax=Anabarilius grahami TaxID=495550 RepID=A0A3N0XJ27_ANAGA|nr:Small ubiquitin-related modifier 2 [Anabarilius grahami]